MEQGPGLPGSLRALEPEFALSRTLLEARRRAELTQAELAERLETTQSVVARLESGRSHPSTRTLEKIARATGTRLRISFDPACDTASRSWPRRNVRGSGMRDTPQLAEWIVGDFYADQFDLSARGLAPHTAWSLMPEVEVTQKLCALGTSDRAIRVFVTLVSAMDRARDATLLWRAAARLFESHPEVFDPARVTSMSARKAGRLYALLSRSCVSQRHETDAGAWWNIAHSLASRVLSPPAGWTQASRDTATRHRCRVPAGGLRHWGRRGTIEGLAAPRLPRAVPLSDASGAEGRADVGADHGEPRRGGYPADEHHSRSGRCASAPRD